MHPNRSVKIKLGFLVTVGVISLLFSSLSTITQEEVWTTRTPDNTVTATSQVVHRAPCEGEATRTPTSIPTLTPTLNHRNPTPTYTATTQNLPFVIPLYYPPNCAVLHSNALPTFRFDALGGPFVTTLIVFNPDTGFHLQIVDYPNVISTPMHLPDGTYYWSVSVSRLSGFGGESEIWEFQIDTNCSCTATPTLTP